MSISATGVSIEYALNSALINDTFHISSDFKIVTCVWF
jgi:hypothetical protein